MNWHAFFAVIAVSSAIGAWMSLAYGLNGTRRAQLYSATVSSCAQPPPGSHVDRKDALMEDLTFLPGVGTAVRCEAEKYHRPKPLRFVWHHILPRTCGGLTTKGNTVSVCDNCHYGIHVLLYELAQHGKLTEHWHLGGTERYAIALRGYNAAVTTGTVAQIPNEGSD